MTKNIVLACLCALSVLDVAKGGCHQDDSVVVKMCQTGVLTGNELFLDANVTIRSNELCSCTVRQTLSGNMFIAPLTGTTAVQCGVEVNFYKTVTSHIYSVYCLTDYAYNDFAEANTEITFKMTGSGRMNTCINMESLVQNSLLTVECTEKIQVASTVAPPTTTKEPTQKSSENPTQPPKPSTQPPKPSTQPPKPSTQPPKPSTQPPNPSTQPPNPSPQTQKPPSSQPLASSPLPTATTTLTTNLSENPTQPPSKSTVREETLQTTIFPFQATRSDILVIGLSLGCGMLILFILVIALIIYIRRHVPPRDRRNKTQETIHVVDQTVPRRQVTSPHDYVNVPDVTGDATYNQTYSELFTEEQTKNVYEKIEDTSFTTRS